ncbi:hypothetical protein [Atlantibacter hermannii]|uniref:hypothetical protein n=1 Tax=Atlantibacter hermannii TaxID=565 RepID=UPI002074921D|nr:hypothetical protein [Atlantibacter hermannii]
MKFFKVKLFILLLFSLYSMASIAEANCAASSDGYPYNKHQEPIQKKVSANSKTYFYSLPDSECKTTIFIINDDKVLKYRDSGLFSYVNYINKKGELIDGWVKSENLVKDDGLVNGLNYRDFSWGLNGKAVSVLGKAMPEIDELIQKEGLKASEPNGHGYNKGFESWVLNIQNAIVTMSQVDNVLQRRLGFNDTYISGIAFTDNEYKTVRGVSVGDGWEKVVSIYGKNSQIDSESGCRFYQYFDMRLSFCLDLSNKVHSVLFEDYPVKPESKLN